MVLHKHFAVIAVLAILAAALDVQAQEPASQPPEPVRETSPLPLTASDSLSESMLPKPMTFRQQLARMQAEQRAARIEWYNWIGYSPLRPTINSTHVWSSSLPPYYMPARGVIFNMNGRTMWYW